MKKEKKENQEGGASVVCPLCHKKIEFLNNIQSGASIYPMDKDGKYGNSEFEPDGQENTWNCPKCGEALFNDEEKAKAFLQGKKVNFDFGIKEQDK